MKKLKINFAKSRMALARSKVQERRKEVQKHVRIETVYIHDDVWKEKRWITIDGLRIKEYTGSDEDRKLYETLYERYYRLHRHNLMTKL